MTQLWHQRMCMLFIYLTMTIRTWCTRFCQLPASLPHVSARCENTKHRLLKTTIDITLHQPLIHSWCTECADYCYIAAKNYKDTNTSFTPTSIQVSVFFSSIKYFHLKFSKIKLGNAPIQYAKRLQQPISSLF